MRQSFVLCVLLAVSSLTVAGKKPLEGPLADPAHWAGTAPAALVGEVAQALEALDPGDSRTLARAGELLLHAGRAAEARETFDRALKSDPNDDEACRIVAIAYREMKMWDEADVWFGKAIALDPKDVDHLVESGVNHWLRGDKVKAAELFTRALASEPQTERLYYKIGLGIGR